MAYAFVMHELESHDELCAYVLDDTGLQRPVILNVVVKTAVIDIVHQEVQVVIVLEAAYYFYKVRRLVQRLQDVPLPKYLGRFIEFQNLLFAQFFKCEFFASVLSRDVVDGAIRA